MGTTGLETAFAALYTELVLPGTIDLDLLVERMTAGAALFGLPTPAIAVGEPANLTSSTSTAEWLAGEHGWESRSENCCFAGRRLTGRVLMTVAAGAVAYRERAFSVVAADGPARARAGDAHRCGRAGGLPLLRHLCRGRARLLEAGPGRTHPRGAAHRQRAVPKGLGHTAPEVEPTRTSRASRRPSSRPRARTDSTWAGGPRRSCAASRHTCASRRPSMTCSTEASKCTCPPTLWARATSSTMSVAWSVWSARSGREHGRVGAVRAARARRARPSSRPSRG